MVVLIISIEGDQSTYKVMDWLLNFYKVQVVLIDPKSETIVSSIELQPSNRLQLKIGDKEISLDDIASFWHRRGNFPLSKSRFEFNYDLSIGAKIIDHLNNEQRKLKEYVHFILRGKKCLGNIFRTDLNKMAVLHSAYQLGIAIPATLITGEKSELIKFYSKHHSVISKPLSEGFGLHCSEGGVISYYTSNISDEIIQDLSDTFHISLFQEEIIKKYELRIFFIDDDYYAMAIFSQKDEKTATDFRRYNLSIPNRTVPYDLPIKIRILLVLLMKQLKLNTGSIDMAVDQNNNYIFFEVNPIGQFAMTSYPCNYYLEKKVATYLTS